MVTSVNAPFLPTPSQAPIAREGQRPRGAASTAPAVATNDTLELRDLSPQQQLNRQIMDRLSSLNDYLQVNGFEPIEQLDPADFTPQKVANRILDFIDLALKQAQARGADDQELARIREQARAGVEEGYQQAYEMLDGLGILQGKVKEEVERTLELLRQGLDRMDRGEPLVQAPEDPQAPQAQQVQLVGQTEERSLALQVQTQDGDLVSINLQRQSSYAGVQYRSQDGEGVFSLNMEKASVGFSFEYRVEGELDQEEEQAIKDLLRYIDRLADDFFSGNTPEIMKKGLLNGFDPEQLQGFSLNMSHVQTSYAAKAYQAVDRLGDGSEGNGVGRQFVPPGFLLQQLRELGDEAGLALGKRFDNPQDLLKELLAQRMELDPRFASVFGAESASPETPQTFTERIMDAAGLGQGQEA